MRWACPSVIVWNHVKNKFGRTAVVSKHSIVYNVLYAFLPTVQLNFHYNIVFLASYLQVNQIK